jgi:hypothetical protein
MGPIGILLGKLRKEPGPGADLQKLKTQITASLEYSSWWAEALDAWACSLESEPRTRVCSPCSKPSYLTPTPTLGSRGCYDLQFQMKKQAQKE